MPIVSTVAAISIAGRDARRFAQTQFSGDVDALAPGHWQWNAWLNAQGRVRALMHLADPGDGTLLAVLRGPGDGATLCAELARFVMRMQVTLSAQTHSGHSDSAAPIGAVANDARGIVLGCGDRSLLLASPSSAAVDTDAARAWRLAEIRAGWPTLPADAPTFLPPALGLEHLGAVAFAKGCYPGQEIATRLHHRGGHKYRLLHLRGAKPLPLGPVQGSDNAPIGWVLDTADERDAVESLAVMPVTTLNNINILDNIYDVVSMFNA